ncbi:MAG: isopenicillin N synthase family oxygenase [Bacteroidetes bacterium]|nr:isopenicillin N synthase family oxygenase [Bacteroidota bacterium]MDA1336369.1 isopenicillin N synthase family oxygenase [Bacteroidota bacterium]
MESSDTNMLAGIPTLDIQSFIQGSEKEKKEFASALGQAYETIGFAAIHGHGIPDELIAKLYSESESFFALPREIKQKYARPEANNQRGFVSMGIEHAKDSKAADLKEFWQVGQPNPPQDFEAEHFPPNEAVAERPEFQSTAVEAFEALELLGIHMLRAIAIHLKIDEFYFDSWVKGGNSILRAIHYPPIVDEPDSAVRAGQHEDINLITLLVGASAAGLEVLRHDNQWIPITALPEHIVVNVGDMLQRLTNHRLKSTTHRVVNPPRSEWSKPRFSMPFFCHPQPEMRLDAMPHLVPEGSQPVDPPISAGAYLEQRLKEIGLAK